MEVSFTVCRVTRIPRCHWSVAAVGGVYRVTSSGARVVIGRGRWMRCCFGVMVVDMRYPNVYMHEGKSIRRGNGRRMNPMSQNYLNLRYPSIKSDAGKKIAIIRCSSQYIGITEFVL